MNVCLHYAKKKWQKLSIFARLSNFIRTKQRRVSQFGYFPLIWILHGRGVNSKINDLHECSLRIVYKDHNSSFKYLLKKDNFVYCSSQKYSGSENLSNVIMNDILQTRTPPANIYMFKVTNRNTRERCKLCSKLTIKTPERRHRCRSGVSIVNFEHISHFFLVYLLLTLNK